MLATGFRHFNLMSVWRKKNTVCVFVCVTCVCVCAKVQPEEMMRALSSICWC